jgi:hypothetical protein
MNKHSKCVSVVLCGVLCSLVLLVVASHAEARGGRYYPNPWWPPCVDSDQSISTMIGQNIDSIDGECESDPLRLERTPDGSLTVDAWKGGYTRSVTMTTTYRIDHYDFCSGALTWSQNKQDTIVEPVSFNIVNPNLGDGLPSYVSNAPLTADEANAELPDALKTCEALHTGAWPQN